MSALRFEQFTDRSNVVYLFPREAVLVANMRHDPQDTPDDATDLAAVLAWQDDALDLLKGGKT